MHFNMPIAQTEMQAVWQINQLKNMSMANGVWLF